MVDDTTARGAAKKCLRERLGGKRIAPTSTSVSKTSASIKKVVMSRSVEKRKGCS